MPICPKCATNYPEGDEHVCPDDFGKTSSNQKELKELVSDMPQVVPDALAAHQKKEDESKKAQGEAVDSKGTKFDPKVHKTDKDGNPIYTPKTGKFARKLNIPEAGSPQAPLPIAPDAIAQEAKEYALGFIMIMHGIIGEEAKPAEGEMESLAFAYEGLLRKYGSIPIGPELKWFMVHAVFVASRANKPKTKALFSNVVGWVKGLWNKSTGKKPEKKEEVAK